MTRRNVSLIVLWISTFCSISGVTGVAAYNYFAASHEPNSSATTVWPVILLGVATIGIAALGYVLYRKVQLYEGTVVPRDIRSRVSREFAGHALRSLDVFAGDLSWLEEDMVTYRTLRERGVAIRILTDNPAASAIPAGKVYGIEFAQYSGNMEAPLRATLCDTTDDTECRALLVKRRTPRLGQGTQAPYEYWMKSYHGAVEAPAIKALGAFFNQMWITGRRL